MNFIQPLFLYGLAAAIIPVVIHLFDFRRTKKVYFSNTKLLYQVKEATRSFYNLKHLLILLTRILFIVFLVGAFAQPYLTPEGDKGLVSDQVGIYIDNSLSMSNLVEQDETGLGLSKRVAQKLIDLYPSGTQFVIQTSFDEKSIYAYRSRQEAKNYLNDIEYTARSRPVNEILSRFENTFSGSKPGDILLFSDFQASSGIGTVKGDSATRLIVLPVTMETYNNVVVDTAFISNPLELDASKRTLTVKIRNYGNMEVSNLPIKIFMNDRQLSVTSATVSPEKSTVMNFNIGANREDKEPGRIILEDYPVSFDNELFFNLQSIEKIKVVQLTNQEPSQYVSAVYGNTQLFDQKIMLTSNIEYQALEEADLIVLNQLSEVYPGLAIRLKEQVQLGASILVIPGIDANPDSFRSLVMNLNLATNDEVKIPIQTPDFSRPFFKDILEKTKDNISMPSARIKWSWGNDRNALLKLIDGTPYLSEVNPNI
ncbi:MAG: BatA domain-containing protein, partial [Bacteroidota bacterium]